MAELVLNSGAVNNKPPFEMGVGNLDFCGSVSYDAGPFLVVNKSLRRKT